MDYNARFYSPYLNRFIQPDSITPAGPQGLNRYSYVSNNPVNFNDPSGHMRIEEQGGKRGCTNLYYCSKGAPRGKDNPYISPFGGKHPSTKPKPAIVPSYEGFSDPKLDAIFEFFEKVVDPINDIVSMEDIYNMSSRGGWKAARYSMNLGIVEAVVQGSRQAYRDSWWQNLTPGERIARAVVVGGEALVTDAIADKVGNGYRAAGFIVGGPLGAAGGNLAGNTFATNVMDRIWKEKVNPILFESLGGVPQ